MVEGPIGAGRENVSEHAVQIIEDIASGNAHRFKTGFSELRIASNVALRAIAHRVRIAVDLDRQSTLKTCEVDDKAGAWDLATKTKSVGALPELLPECDLW